jgi:hypothetical protein
MPRNILGTRAEVLQPWYRVIKQGESLNMKDGWGGKATSIKGLEKKIPFGAGIFF